MDACFQIADCDSMKMKSDEYLSTLELAGVFVIFYVSGKLQKITKLDSGA